jgi:replication-associated recombination protein RarA
MDEKTSQKTKGGKPEKQQKKKRETKLGYKLDEVASALQKEIRHGDTEAAVYWALLLHGTAPQYCWKRVLVTAAEDVGLADPDVVHKVCGLAQAWKISKEQAWYVSPHHLAMAVTLLCRAPKSTEIEDLLSYTLELIARGIKKPMEDYSIDTHTEAGRATGRTIVDWYDHRHLTFGVPVNRYTRMLVDLVPEWFSPRVKDLLKATKEEKTDDHD